MLINAVAMTSDNTKYADLFRDLTVTDDVKRQRLDNGDNWSQTGQCQPALLKSPFGPIYTRNSGTYIGHFDRSRVSSEAK